jgi:spore coat polysaccharide biosynthesis protein SpsF (cytidylyltransferase family)
MGSQRLPGKMLRRIKGETLIGIAYRKACEAFGKENVYFTVPYDEENAPLIHYLGDMRVNGEVWWGDENDVLGRFYDLASKNNAKPDDIVYRWTPDDYRRQPEMCRWVADGQAGIPVEMGGEAFTFQALKHAHETETDPHRREHIGLIFNPDPVSPPDDGLPWSIDCQEDLDAANNSFYAERV